MFTGIVETTARVRSLERVGADARLVLEVALEGLSLGESISVSGVCLTVVSFDAASFAADVSVETLRVTTLGKLTPGARVNLERSLKASDRLGGHWVLGHVDGVGAVSALEEMGGARRVVFEAPRALMRYLAPKGSVAIDGVSLTINRLVDTRGFDVMLVPHTLAVTTLSSLAVGTSINLEIDVLARYVARQLDYAGVVPSGDASLAEALRRAGLTE
jgi:riboflavin synthase